MSWLILYALFEWGIRIVMAVVILRRQLSPATSLAWLVLIFLLPVFGLAVYLLVGVNYLGKRRAVYHREVIHSSREEGRLAMLKQHTVRPQTAPEQQTMIVHAERISGNPIVAGNYVELIAESGDLHRRMVYDIDASHHHVHLMYYIFRLDAIGHMVTDALKRAVSRGVICRVLVDAAGSREMLRKGLANELREQGVHVHAMLPVAPWRRKLARIDLRNHRKVAVIDGRIAYAGSHNIVEEDYGHPWAGKWVDLSGRFTGPVVSQCQMVFLDDWRFETGERLDDEYLFPSLHTAGDIPAQVVPTGPSHEGESFRRVLLAALYSAQRKIIMTTPYLVPDEPTMLALSMAAERGVEVLIIVPERSDHHLVAAAGRSYFDKLIESGVKICQYRGGMLHAKTITVDDAFALLGSANIDIRSFYLNFELNVLLYGPQITGELRFAQQQYLSDSHHVDLPDWRRRPAIKRYTENAAALLSPLL